MKVNSSLLFTGLIIILSCTAEKPIEEKNKLEVNQFFDQDPKKVSNILSQGAFLDFEVEVPTTGRYKIKIEGNSDSAKIWIEDYVDNQDGRTYDITGYLTLSKKESQSEKFGSPLAQGLHKMRIHSNAGSAKIEKISFSLIHKNRSTPLTLTQNMVGENWKLVWSDEFDGEGIPDSTKWKNNYGNWGWGNKEPQFYTYQRPENSRMENGSLIIEARKDDMGYPWTSTRLTTQGAVSFLYGKVEFRAKVPAGKGTWAAGWMLGDSYSDELSWPYCGEIDILECVGYEINDSTGAGLNHATCHTPAYYFKIGNQISGQIEMEKMDTEFHTYSMEWYPDSIICLVDDVHYYTYDKTANEKEWPFDKPQSIIVNLAVGGGWGGAKGIDPSFDNHKYILDYIRVYELE